MCTKVTSNIEGDSFVTMTTINYNKLYTCIDYVDMHSQSLLQIVIATQYTIYIIIKQSIYIMYTNTTSSLTHI